MSNVLIQKKIPFFCEESRSLLEKEKIQYVKAYLRLAFEDNTFNPNSDFLKIINKAYRDFGPKKLRAFKDVTSALNISTIEQALSEEKKFKDKRCRAFSELLREIRKIASSSEKLKKKISKIIEESSLFFYFEKIDNRRVQNIKSFLSLISDVEFKSIA